MAKKKDILTDQYFEIGLKSYDDQPRERVLHVKKLEGTKEHGKNGMITTEEHLKDFDLEDIFGHTYRKSNIRYVKRVSETDDVMLVLGKLSYS